MSHANKKRRHEHRPALDSKAEVAPDAVTLQAQMACVLGCLPPELLHLVAESVLLPYKYTWVPRRKFTLKNETTAVFSDFRLVAAVAAPSFRCLNSPNDGKYVADWVVGRGMTDLTGVRFWAGICDPTAISECQSDIDTYLGVSMFSDSGNKLLISSSISYPIYVSTNEFAKHGLRFSLDYSSNALSFSVGNIRRSIACVDECSNWKACAPFVSVAVLEPKGYPVDLQTLPANLR